MIKYKVIPEGSDKWTPANWEKWYRQFNDNIDDMPRLFGKLMVKALERMRRIITTKYLTKSAGGVTIAGKAYSANPGVLHVQTGRGRASVHYNITKQSKAEVVGEIGSNVWYMRMHHKGGVFSVSRGTKGGGSVSYTLKFRAKPWLKMGVEDEESVSYTEKLFEKAGLRLFKT
ncbi:MAG: hypothetical protein R6V04_02805 [bacterium]